MERRGGVWVAFGRIEIVVFVFDVCVAFGPIAIVVFVSDVFVALEVREDTLCF